MIRFRTRVVLACLLAATSACSSPTPESPTAPSTPPAPVSSTTTLTGTVAAYGTTSHDYSPARTGTLTATLTWTGTADLDLYVTASSCTGYPPDACALLARSTASSGQREEVTLTLRSTSSLKVWVDNFHPTMTVPYTLAVTLQ